ncbi:hypothetical protein T484DRAFT_3475724 [Baffinella frigidus]|nr:hypothetical protein T484DRAFT_3475724 [Cryptophyta sp. CCMP2293]
MLRKTFALPKAVKKDDSFKGKLRAGEDVETQQEKEKRNALLEIAREEKLKKTALLKPKAGKANQTSRTRGMLDARQLKQSVDRSQEEQRLEATRLRAATKLQSWWRMCRMAKIGPLAFMARRSNNHRTRAVLHLQRVYRGHVARSSGYLGDILWARERRHFATLRLQRVVRGHWARQDVAYIKYLAEEWKLFRMAALLQRFARGWCERRMAKTARNLLRYKVFIIERFTINYFQPWQRRNVFLIDVSLKRIVHVQANARRYLAVKHARETRIGKEAALKVFGWHIVAVVVLGIFMSATNAPSNDAHHTNFRDAVESRVFPRAATPAAASSVLRKFSSHRPSPFLGEVAQPHLFWAWLLGPFLEGYRALGRTDECSALDGNARTCNVTMADAFPGTVWSALDVRQYRGSPLRFHLPRSGEQPGPCPAAQIGAGGICRMPVEFVPRNASDAQGGGGNATTGGAGGNGTLLPNATALLPNPAGGVNISGNVTNGGNETEGGGGNETAGNETGVPIGLLHTLGPREVVSASVCAPLKP